MELVPTHSCCHVKGQGEKEMEKIKGRPFLEYLAKQEGKEGKVGG